VVEFKFSGNVGIPGPQTEDARAEEAEAVLDSDEDLSDEPVLVVNTADVVSVDVAEESDSVVD
jgi:hypothetical protein